MKKNFQHKLMENNFDRSDIKSIIKFLRNTKNPILTQSKNVKIFEKKWSDWLGTNYSVYVNSGSSANLLTILALKIFKKISKGEIIVPALTWVSDVNAVIQNNLKPVFVDINPKTLSMDENMIKKKINKKTVAVFITHAQGFNGLSKSLISFLKKKKVLLIEDVCESHGATFQKKKLGSFGIMSNFSFYYAHHMSTIEGGMISTNNRELSELLKSLRSHGMLREIGNPKKEKKIIKRNPHLSPKFIFPYSGYNFRNNEIGAVLGLNQLKRLDKNIRLRNLNFKYFLKNIDKDLFETNFDLEGCSNYAFPLILKSKNFKIRDRLENLMIRNNIEFRRGNAGGGNQLRQPYLKKYVKRNEHKKFKIVEHIHFFGYYIGNYPSLKKNKIKKICNILNSLK